MSQKHFLSCWEDWFVMAIFLTIIFRFAIWNLHTFIYRVPFFKNCSSFNKCGHEKLLVTIFRSLSLPLVNESFTTTKITHVISVIWNSKWKKNKIIKRRDGPRFVLEQFNIKLNFINVFLACSILDKIDNQLILIIVSFNCRFYSNSSYSL